MLLLERQSLPSVWFFQCTHPSSVQLVTNLWLGTNEWLGWFMRLQTTGSFLLTAPLFITVISLPYHFLNSCHDGLCTTINTDSCGLAISNSCGSIFANCNLSAKFRKLLGPKFHYTLHTHSLPHPNGVHLTLLSSGPLPLTGVSKKQPGFQLWLHLLSAAQYHTGWFPQQRSMTFACRPTETNVYASAV